MTHCKGRQDDNGESFNDNNFSSTHGKHSDSPSQHDSRDFETHRDKEPDQERGRRGDYHDDYESTRISGFDVAPSASAILVGGVVTAAGQVPGTTAAIPGMFSKVFALPVEQTTRHAHQVYVGGLPPTVNEEGAPVKVRGPSDYNPLLTASLGSSPRSCNLNLAAVGPRPGSAGGLEGHDCILVGGLPYYFTEEQIRELLEAFGVIQGFDLVKDRETGISKGYAFCVYEDLSVTDIVCATLNGIRMGDRTLIVRRAIQGASQPKPEQETILFHAQEQVARRPNPDLNLAAAAAAGPRLEGRDCIFVGGLPYYFTEEQIRELLEAFGDVEGFDLVKDRETGNSKGYGFCVYEDVSVTDIVCTSLNGVRMGDRTLVVRRASQG